MKPSKTISSKAVRQRVKPSGENTFFGQADDFLSNLKKAGKFNQYTPYKQRLDVLRSFLNGGDLDFSDVTVGLLEKFKTHLKSLQTMGERTVINHFVPIRSVFAHARKNKIVTKAQSPFGGEGFQIKFPESVKIGLDREEIERIENLKLLNPAHDHVRNLWLFSFYFAGMRISDILRVRWSDFHDGRFYYVMGKNNKADSLKISERVKKLLEKYKSLQSKENDLVFPELKEVDLKNTFETQRVIRNEASAIDQILRKSIKPKTKITKKLSMHIARHSFGNISGDKIPPQKLRLLYRHENISTTIQYQKNFSHDGLDAALDAVIGI